MFVLKPLKHRSIALLWSGQVLSSIGDETYRVAVVWLAVGLVGADAGYLAAVQAASVLIFGLLGGIWADHWDQRRTMIWVDLLRGLIVLAPPIIASVMPLSIWTLFVVVVTVSSLSALFDPALQAVLPQLAGNKDQLQATNALLQTTRRLAFIAGPGLVGVLQRFIPVVHFFTLDAISFALSASSIAALHRELPSKAISRSCGITSEQSFAPFGPVLPNFAITI